jgi:hypothetical protein
LAEFWDSAVQTYGFVSCADSSRYAEKGLTKFATNFRKWKDSNLQRWSWEGEGAGGGGRELAPMPTRNLFGALLTWEILQVCFSPSSKGSIIILSAKSAIHFVLFETLV